MNVCLTPQKFQMLMKDISPPVGNTQISVKCAQSTSPDPGLMAAASQVVPLALLHMLPLQQLF